MWRFKRILASCVGVALALAICAPSAYAWGPERKTFTMENPAPYNTFNSITDNPDVGDERNFFRVRDVNQDKRGEEAINEWTDAIELKDGGEYEACVYVANSAENRSSQAENVHVSVNMPTKDSVFGYAFVVNAFVSADNAKPKQIWDNVVLKSEYPFHVKIISAVYYNNIKTEKSSGFKLGEDLFTRKGSLIGYRKMDGMMPASFAASGYVLIRFKYVGHPFWEWMDSRVLGRIANSWDMGMSKKTECSPGEFCDF